MGQGRAMSGCHDAEFGAAASFKKRVGDETESFSEAGAGAPGGPLRPLKVPTVSWQRPADLGADPPTSKSTTSAFTRATRRRPSRELYSYIHIGRLTQLRCQRLQSCHYDFLMGIKGYAGLVSNFAIV